MRVNVKRTHQVGRHIPLPPLGFGFLLTLLATTLIVVLTALVYNILFADRIYLGVYALGIEVGGKTRAQAEFAIGQQVQRELTFPITLYDGNTEWTYPAPEVGASMDATRLASQAYAVGRRADFVSNLLQQLQALRQGAYVGTSIQFDSGPANVVLAQIGQQIDRPARNVGLVINPDMSIEVLPPQTGLALDVDATRRKIQENVLSRHSDPISLVITQTSPSVTQSERAQQTLRALLAGPLTLSMTVDGVVVEIMLTPDELRDMLVLEEGIDDAGIGQILVKPTNDRWEAYLTKIAEQVRRDPIDARFEIDPDTGELSVLRESRVGYELDVPQAMAMVGGLFEQPQARLQLPLAVIQPAVPMEAGDTMGFDNLIVEATTYFKGSAAARVHNIEVAAAKFQGIVLPPGAVFSFNHYLGDVTAENGFEESLIIWGDRTDVGIGGGVCQVSTTAFRAALFGGFDIVERWAHGYRVSWYETGSGPGMDATIYVPDVDFRFRNDTQGYLLIQTETDAQDGTVSFRFYGPPTNRVVEVAEPIEENLTLPGKPIYEDDPSLPKGTTKQVEWEKEGLDVTVKRVVQEGDTVVHKDTFVSHYRPWQAMYLVGTGEKTSAGQGED